MRKYLLVGADPVKAASVHPGGVVTLSIGLLDYARRNNHEVVIVNTARSGFNQERLLTITLAGLKRVVDVFVCLCTGRVSGAIIFAGAGIGFYERILISLMCRLFRVNDAFVIVDGNFFGLRQASGMRRSLTRLMLCIPYRLSVTGPKWNELFDELGVGAYRRIPIHYWLTADFPIARQPKSRPQGRPVRMLFVGWLIREKGVYELLSAITQLRCDYDFSFVFAGGGTLLETVRQVISENNWKGRVEAPGWISGEVLRQHFASADVFVLPSYAEGFPMSLIEAFSFGMPAIVSDVGGVSDSIRDGINGFLIDPMSVESLVGAMSRYLTDPGLIPVHSCAALETVSENHDPDINCRTLFDALD